MKVIKKGKVPFKEKRFECGYCGCEFLADENDRKADQRDGDYVVCPTCGKFISWSMATNKERI